MSIEQPTADYAPFFTALGAASAISFAAMGAAFATARAGVAVVSVGVNRPDIVFKSLIPIVMGGIIAIYGMVIAILIITNGRGSLVLSNAYLYFGSGLSVGLSGLAAGVTIGIVGDAGTRGVAQQPAISIGFVLILIFAEVLALYGFIVAILMTITG